MTIAFRPLRNPNPLGFPGAVPTGVDWSHPAANGIFGANYGVSAVAVAGNFVNLLSGSAGVVAGAPSAATISGIGPAVLFNANGKRVSFSGQATPGTGKTTFALIFQLSATTAAFKAILAWGSSATTQTYVMGLSSAGQLQVFTSGSVLSGFTPTVGVPYFCAVSFLSTSVVNFLLLNLSTGQIQSSAITTATALTEGSFFVIGDSQGSQNPNAYISDVMASHGYMQMPQLLAWAADPWSFWYPRRDGVFVGAAVAAFKAYWAQQNNLPVIGAGTY